MLHPNFIFAFTVTLVTLGGLSAVSLIGLSVYRFYQLWRRSPASSWLAQAQRSFSGFAGKAWKVLTGSVSRLGRATLAVLVIRPATWFWNQLLPVRQAVRARATREIGLGLACWLFVALLPLTAFGSLRSPWETVAGIAAAGAVIGLALSPVFIWKTKGPFLKRIAVGALTVAGSSYLALFVIAFLIVGASD